MKQRQETIETRKRNMEGKNRTSNANKHKPRNKDLEIKIQIKS